MASTVWQTAGDGREGSYTAKQVEQDMLHSGLEETPLMVLDSPTDTVADSNLNECVSESMVENVVYIGSYNWVDSAEPIILVPGSPPLWCDRGAPYTLSLDRDMFAFEDAYRVPPSLQNLARMNAIDIMTGENGVHVDWPNIDFITDRNALRKLLGWAGGYAGRAFRIDLEFAGSERSYGFSFEHESTQPAPGCEGTTGHYRISSYCLGAEMIVSYEVDACIATTTTLDSTCSATSDPIARYPNVRLLALPASKATPHEDHTDRHETQSKPKTWTSTYPSCIWSIPYLYRDHTTGIQQSERARAEEALLSLRRHCRRLPQLRDHGHHGHLPFYERTSQASCLPSEILQRFTRIC
ncbi:uncharacterized protein B0H18DRAFT_1028387 [Fomitopsis serialis]|uniref:uncharacterized protein n=1 Tax=Fomitopsis serialis TaxID=139415 RepID=UPI00200773A7|nr:uncharacterized protein B0H18DRAFT_1028387 [Neoantrodia serialis]KAH9919326.1 hypothetical protein B0H18DRAFT_1028387 [Neoantrodia serialis]